MKMSIEVDEETAEFLRARASEEGLPADVYAGKYVSSIRTPGSPERAAYVQRVIDEMARARTNGLTGDELIALTRSDD